MKNCKNILNDKNLQLKKCFKITLQDNTTIAFIENNENINIDNITYLSSKGFDGNEETFYNDLTSGESSFLAFIENNNITTDEVINGKFDKAQVDIFFYDLYSKEKIYITKGVIKSINILDGKILINISNILDVLDKNIGELYSPTCRAKFCDKKCKLNIDNYTYKGYIVDIKNNTEFSCNTDITKDKDYFKYGLIKFTSGKNINQIIEVKQSFNQIIILNNRPSYELSIGDTFDITAGCDKELKTCAEKFNNTINFRGEPFITTTTKMYKFY